MTLKNFVKILLILSVLYGMIVTYEPMNAPVSDSIVIHGWDCLFIIPGIIGWCILMIASVLIPVAIIQ